MDGIRTRYAFAANPTADLPADTSLAYLYDPSGNVAERMELLFNNDTTGQPDGQGLYVQVRDYQVYDAFGALSGRMDTDTYPMVAMDLDPVGFGGQEGYYTDTETGLVLLGARYYDASTGRFLNRDPIGYDGGVNLYGFCGNNPVNESDPEGTDWLDNASNFSAGAGDFISGGYTQKFRKALGYDDVVNKTSDVYGYGRDAGIAYVAVDTVVGGVGVVNGARTAYTGIRALRAAGGTKFGVVAVIAAARAVKGGLAFQVRDSAAVHILQDAKTLKVIESHPETITQVFGTYQGRRNITSFEYWRHVFPHEHTYELGSPPSKLNANWRKTFINLHATKTTVPFKWW